MSDRLPPPEMIAPVKACRNGSGHIVCDTGFSEWDGGGDWGVVTDHVRASGLSEMEFRGDAKDDAEAIAAIINAYRTGRLVLEQMPLLALASKDAEIERLRARIAVKDTALDWIAERTGGFCPGSWESGISARARKALEG